MMSMKSAAPPSRAGDFAFEGLNVERQLVAFELRIFQHHDGILHRPSLLKTDRVAFGGFLVKLSSPDPHSAIISAVGWWPADRTGRSANKLGTRAPFLGGKPAQAATIRLERPVVADLDGLLARIAAALRHRP